MAKNMGQINFGVGFQVNKASLDQVKKSIQELRNMSKEQIEAAGGNILPLSGGAVKSWKNDLGEMRKELDALDKAMEAAFNPKLGTYELNRFNEALKSSGTSAQRVFETVSAYGNTGSAALLNMTTQMLATDRAAKQVHGTFQKLGETMMNTIRWSITSTAINTVTGAIQQAYHYALDLDESLNDIMIVTDKSAEEMERFARSANKAAKGLGASTKDYTGASLIYYQQGLSDQEVKARTDTTLKAAAVTGQSASAVSEQLTAVWNGYKVSAEESELYIDKLAAVAADTAADLEELSTGMSKVASAANVMGVDIDQLNAQLATVISVTRQAPESVGTALKTVYARMSDIEAGLDSETTLGEYTTQMAEMGINVLDAKGNLREMGDVIEEIGNKWNTFNREQQVALTQSIAGTRQYNNMMALFEGWDMYQKALTTSANAAGTLASQHMDYMQGLEASQKQLQTSAEGLYQSIFKSEDIKGVLDGLTEIVTLVDKLVQSMGGMPGILATVGMLFAKAAKNSIADLVTKQQANKLNNEIYRNQINNGKEIIEQQMSQIKVSGELEQHFEKIKNFETEIYNNADNLSDDQWNSLQEGVRKYNEQIQHTIELERERQGITDELSRYWQEPGRVTRTGGGRRKQTTLSINGKEKSYYLADVDDEHDGKKTQGLKSLKEDRENLKKLIQNEKKINGIKSEKVKVLGEEYREVVKNIKLAEKENKTIEESTKRFKENADAIEKSKNATDKLGNETDEFLKKSLQGNRLASIAEGFTSIAFSAISVSQSVGQFIKVFGESDSTLEDYLGSLAGVVLGLTPLIDRFVKANAAKKASIEATKAAAAAEVEAAKKTGDAAKIAAAEAEASGKVAQAGAKGWKAFQAAMGPVGWIMLAVTAITIITSAVSAFQEKARETARKAAEAQTEEAKAARELAEQNTKLTQSYLNSYSAYEKTGEEKEKLLELAEKLTEAYKNEEFRNLALAGSYELVAQKAKEARLEQLGIQLAKAEEGKEGLEGQIGALDPNKTSGFSKPNYRFTGEAWADWLLNETFAREGTARFSGDVDSESAKLLRENVEAISGSEKLHFNVNGLTPEEKVKFYKQVEQVTHMEGWDPASTLNQSVQAFLADENWKKLVADYDAINLKISSLENVEIPIAELSSDLSLTEVKDQREQLITNYMNSSGASRTVAENAIDTTLLQDSELAPVVTAVKWAEGQLASGNLSEQDIEALYGEQGLDTLDETELDALSFIDAENFKGKMGELLKAARQKAKELRDQYMLDAKDEVLQSSNQRIQDLEKDIAKATGEEKLGLIQKQNEELQNQIELLERIRDESAGVNKENAQTDFKNLAAKYHFDTENLKIGKDQEWDVLDIKDDIQADENLSADQKNNLLKLLFKDVLQSQNKYSALNEDIKDLTENLDENNIEEFEVKLNTKIDLNNLQKEYTDFVRSFAKENDYTELIKFDLQDFSTSLQSIEDYKASISELQKSDLDPAYKEAQIREFINNIMAEGTNLLEKRNSLEQNYLNYNDAVNESYEQYLSLIESANGLLEHQVELNELIYGDKAFKHMQDYYTKQVTNNQLIVTANNERYQTDKADYEALLKEGLSVDDPKVKAARDRYLESGEAYAASLAAQAQGYADQYSNTLENILDNFTKDMLDEDAMKEWDWIQSTSDMFVDEIEEAYEKSKLQKAFSKAINESQSLKAQQALNKAHQEELKMLEKKDKLTQYDLERAQKRLDIEIARLALEEARDSKTQMRLMRQADGTYGYQYVADQSAIEEKQTQYETALKARYDSDQSELSSQMSKSQQLIENFKSEISELNPASETYENDLQAIIDKYKPLLKAQGSNVSRVLENLRLSSAEMSSLYGTEVVTPELSSSAVQQIVDWGSDDGAMLDALMKELVTGQESAKSGIGAARDTLDSLVSSMYTSIVGSGANDEQSLLGAQNKQIDTLNDMSSAMLGVITTIGLLDEAIKIAKGDVKDLSGAQGVTTNLATKYNITSKADGTVEMTPKAFDTGGYTGAWGPDGRLATLHEKELVLNKYDTANILSAVDIVRSLGDSMLKTVSGMGRGYDLPMAAWELAKDFIIEQTVHINAEFPNAADRSEIEAAFEELMLLATQHAFEDVRGR